MNRLLFTIDADVYELTARLKTHILNQTRTPETLALWFDAATLHHAYYTPKNSARTEHETTNVIETFETYPDTARQELEAANSHPIINASAGLYTTDTSTNVNPRNHA